MKRPYLKPWSTVIKLQNGNNILETFSAKATTKDYEFGGNIDESDWADADGEFL